jgi:hypothetical protein
VFADLGRGSRSFLRSWKPTALGGSESLRSKCRSIKTDASAHASSRRISSFCSSSSGRSSRQRSILSTERTIRHRILRHVDQLAVLGIPPGPGFPDETVSGLGHPDPAGHRVSPPAAAKSKLATEQQLTPTPSTITGYERSR